MKQVIQFHEHMRKELVDRINPQKAYDYFLRNQGWSREVVDQQVLTPLSEESVMSTPADQTSIMCYQQPGSITYHGKPIFGGHDINATDYKFARAMYPSTIKKECIMREKPDLWEEIDDVDHHELNQRICDVD